MQRRDENDNYISYQALQDQFKNLAIYNDILAISHQPDLNRYISDVLAWMPNPPNVELNISPFLREIRVYHSKIIELAKQRRCPLNVIYQHLFLHIWSDDNVAQIKQVLKNELIQGKVSLGAHYEMDEFFKVLSERKKTFLSILKIMISETKQPSDAAIKMSYNIIDDHLENCGLKKIVMKEIDNAFNESLVGWEKYSEVKQNFLVEKTQILNYSSPFTATAKKGLHAKKQELEKIVEQNEERQLYAVALKYEEVKRDLKSIIYFINEEEENFPCSFKKNLNQDNILTYINEYYAPVLPKEPLRIIATAESSHLQLKCNFKYVVNDLASIKFSWSYVEKLGDFFQKNLYRLAMAHYIVKTQNRTCKILYTVWVDTINDMLCKKELNPEAVTAIMQASFSWLKRHSDNLELNRCLQDYTEDKPQPLDSVRQKWFDNLTKKEREYYPDVKSENYQSTKTLFLRLVAVNYLKNAIQSGRELITDTLKNELVSQFGEEILLTRGFFESHISTVLKSLNIPQANHEAKFNLLSRKHS